TLYLHSPQRTCSLPSTRKEVGTLIYGLFAAQSPRPPTPLSTLQETPRDVPSKTRGQDGFATSFPVGLLHPLQHAGLTRRSPSSRPFVQNRRKIWSTSYPLRYDCSRMLLGVGSTDSMETLIQDVRYGL